MDMIAPHTPHYQGYLDERSTHHVKGWLRNLNNMDDRLEFEVILPEGASERVIASGVADAFSPILVAVGVGDGSYALLAEFAAPLTEAERDRVFVRPRGASFRLELAPALKTDPPSAGGPYQGYVDERSTRHVRGWVRDLSAPERRVEVEILLREAEGTRLLHKVTADLFSNTLQLIGVGDGRHAFDVIFPAPVSEAERDRIEVRPAGAANPLDLAPELRTEFAPILYVAMDIVNNCNLRCPFCLYDYGDTHKTYFMSDETFDAALRLIPFVTDGNFWLSCLHEATLHPRMAEFIGRVPLEYRRKLFFTTNLAKRMPQDYFEMLARAGVHHINISLESLDPPLYERMRKGARFRIFQENWDQLLRAFAAAPNPPPIQYNIMAYRSNLKEIPGLIDTLLREKRGWQVEVRDTFDGPQIDRAFRDAEFLSREEWAWLAAETAHFPPGTLLMSVPSTFPGEETGAAQPPQPAPEALPEQPAATKGRAVRPFNVRIDWDGTLFVYSELPRGDGEEAVTENYLVTNIKDLADPLSTLFALERGE